MRSSNDPFPVNSKQQGITHVILLIGSGNVLMGDGHVSKFDLTMSPGHRKTVKAN